MILCVDADDDARAAMADAIDDAGFQTVSCASASEAREVLADADRVDCLVTELRLEDATGFDLVREVREHDPDAACVLFTDTPVEDVDTETVGDLVVEYLRKDVPDAHERLVSLVVNSVAFRSQTAYPLPDDEDARLAALERYAADPDALEASLDRLSELATALFDSNSAGVGLVDAHEQRFIACHGAAFDVVEREETICTYAILDDDVTVIEDIGEDPRFEDNDALADADVRFYAGAPIRTPDGQAIGTLCIHDDEPRSFAARDRELLSMLADEAFEQLELRRRLDEGGASS
jgi:GAF domain-containing protein